MELSAAQNPLFALPTQIGQKDATALAADFAAMLGSKGGDAKAHSDELRDAAVQFVGMAFFLPMLSQARKDPFRTEMFHGGFAEDAFGNQMDQTLADEMARRDSTGLVDAIIRKFSPAATGGKVDARG